MSTALSPREIARRAGVSHGAPRRYFPTHLSLLSAIARRGFESLAAQAGAAIAAHEGDPREQLTALARSWLDFALTNRGMFELMFRHDCPRGRRLTLVASVTGAVIVALDGTVLTVAQPRLQRDLNATFAQVQWTSTGYLIAVASLLVFAGRLGDRYGHRRVFAIGMLGFGAASAGIGLAGGIGWVIGLRVAQGFSGRCCNPPPSGCCGPRIRPTGSAGRSPCGPAPSGWRPWPVRWLAGR